MGANENVTALRKGYEAFDAADLDTVRALIAQDAIFHVGGDSKLTGDYKGQDEIFGLFGDLVSLAAGTLKHDIHDIIANDEHGVVIVTVTAEAGGKRLQQREAHIVHMANGQITEWWGFEEDQLAGNAFWGK